jgi:hypothetical protein
MRSEFLAELFTEADDHKGRAALVQRAREAAEQSTAVRFVRSIFVPEDEMCFFVFEAESADAVALLAEQAALPIDRVVRAEL